MFAVGLLAHIREDSLRQHMIHGVALFAQPARKLGAKIKDLVQQLVLASGPWNFSTSPCSVTSLL